MNEINIKMLDMMPAHTEEYINKYLNANWEGYKIYFSVDSFMKTDKICIKCGHNMFLYPNHFLLDNVGNYSKKMECKCCGYVCESNKYYK